MGDFLEMSMWEKIEEKVEAVWGRQPEKRQKAFFEANAIVSGLVLGGVVWEIFWK